MAARSTSRMKSSTQKLSDVARHVVHPAGVVRSGWPRVAAVIVAFGIVFDAWQVGAARLILGKTSAGLYAADTVVLSIPRQVGKTFLLGAIVLALCILNPGLLVIWTAHHTATSDETFADMQALARVPGVAKHIRTIRAANGQQSIVLRNGARIRFGARERGFGRGFKKVGVLVLDEAQILTQSALDNLVPTTNQVDNPLVLMAGTPPRPQDPGEAFTNLRKEALDAGPGNGDTLYIEFSADPDAVVTDRAQWRKANPSYPARTAARAILRMLKHLGEASFRREALGIWDVAALEPRLLTVADWDDCAGAPGDDGSVAYGVKFSPDGARMALAVAMLADEGRVFVEVLESGSTSVGLSGLTRWLSSRWRDCDAMVIDGRANAGALTEALRDSGVPGRRITRPTVDGVITGSSRLIELVKTRRVVHAGQAGLRHAATNVVRRKIGTQGGWGFDPAKGSDADIPALDAVALAVSGLKNRPTAAETDDARPIRRTRSGGRRAVVM